MFNWSHKSATATVETELSQKKCVPCRTSVMPVSGERLEELLAQVPNWHRSEDGRTITRTFKFADWAGSADYAFRCAELAEEEGHHPDIHLYWGKVTMVLTTHKIKGLSENDFILATKFDQLYEDSDLE